MTIVHCIAQPGEDAALRMPTTDYRHAQMRAYNLANPEALRAHQADYRERNRTVLRERQRLWAREKKRKQREGLQ